jgi:hypothetical protein
MALWLTLMLTAAPPQPLLDGDWARTLKDRELRASMSVTELRLEDLTLHGKGPSTRVTCALNKVTLSPQRLSATCTVTQLRAGPDLGRRFVDVPTTPWARGFDGIAGTEVHKGVEVALELERTCSAAVAERRLCLAGACVTLPSAQRPRERPAGSTPRFEVRALSCDEDELAQALDVVWRGYSERNGERSFEFRTAPLPPRALPALLALVGFYNRFDGAKIAAALAPLAQDLAQVQFGREGSPVLYLRFSATSAKDRQAALERVKEALLRVHADELHLQPDGSLRAWWD